jgi:hypothetical protein
MAPQLASISEEQLAATINDLLQAHRNGDPVPQTIDVGSVVYLSYGYDCTYIEFYVVVRRTARTATLQRICGQVTSHGPAHERWGKVIASPHYWPEAEPVRAWVTDRERQQLSVNATYGGRKYGYAWDGREQFWSDYTD